MIQNYQCPKCSKKFTSLEVKSGKCPDCKKWMNYLEASEIAEVIEPVRSTKKAAVGEATFSDLVAAQDRTTYAVRSLSVFFFISLQSSLFGYGIILWGGEDFATFGSLVIVVGFLLATFLGKSQLDKSKP
jgi:predicted ATP-dependent serine protease